MVILGIRVAIWSFFWQFKIDIEVYLCMVEIIALEELLN